ncbi:hypothetical protein [Jiangella muralis]|uniref:hypothetical protein n=1 Tax=Jiangella muralis TaxID=702383 RepID=UPI0012FACB0D|nr:hypothetical protein [Jiangella muralis]
MTVRSKLSRAEVEAMLSDEQREKLASLHILSYILAQSVITADYKPSDDLRNAIRPSPYGQWLLQQSKKYDFEVREARLACLLELFHLDVLVDIETTDVQLLATAITKEIRTGRLTFAMPFGPALYRRAADLFPDERRSLNSVDTQRLLDGQPTGVFHFGNWLGGPWGLYLHSASRRIRPTHFVPLQHCHDVSCWAVHRVMLSSDSSAEIIKARADIRKALESEGEEASEFAVVISDALRNPVEEFDPDSLGAIGYLIGDALGDAELRVLLEYLLDGHDAANIRRQVEALTSLRGKATLITEARNRPELLQMILLASDEQIATALDHLLFDKSDQNQLTIPTHEVRRSVLTRATSSAFGSRPELSRFGVRTISRAAPAPLKLRRLIDSIYGPSLTGSESSAELDWQLRSIPSASTDASLTEYLRKTPPEIALQRLVLNTRENVKRGAASLSLNIEDGVNDLELVQRMLWKLGFDVIDADELHEDFWRHSDRLRKAAESASVSTSVGEEEISEISTSYFRALEKLLADTLVFCVWAFTTDHVRDQDPYLYVDNNVALDRTTRELGAGLAVRRDIYDAKLSIEKWTLQPLFRGFEVLSDVLGGLEARALELERPANSVPDFANEATVQRFPFRHTSPFLDLTAASRELIHSTLQRATGGLLESNATEVRNGLLHYRRSNVDLKNLVGSLEAVESVIRNLESQGLVRIVYRRQRVETDRWGRSLHTLADATGSERAISRPSAYAWVNLPRLDEPQYLMTIAQFDQFGEYLRFLPGSDSDYRELWTGVPQRRQRSVTGRTPSDSDGAVPLQA